MNNQTYYRKPVVSPLQLRPQHPVELMMKKATDTQDKEHPVRKEIERVIGSYQLEARVEEDTETISTLARQGVIAFLCTVKRDGQIIGIGRGSAVLNQNHKFIERTVHSAFNSCLLSAIAQSSKCLDAVVNPHNISVDETPADGNSEMATTKQKDFLTQLVNKKVRDESVVGWWMENIGTMTKNDASTAIQELSGK